jgi:hypothetical protein
MYFLFPNIGVKIVLKKTENKLFKVYFFTQCSHNYIIKAFLRAEFHKINTFPLLGNKKK